MRLGISDDYATLRVANTDFYYGYEVEDAAGRWAFEMRLNGHRVQIAHAELLASGVVREGEDPERFLLAGIGLLVERGILKWN